MSDQAIKDILAKYDEDFASNTWIVPGGKSRAILHKCIERMVVKAQITFDPPTVVSADPENIAIIVTGYKDNRPEWSFGEASPRNNKNAYGWSMAEKRGKDRVALKLLGLHGLLYSEEESEDFKPQERRSQAWGDDDPRAVMLEQISRLETEPEVVTFIGCDRSRRALNRMTAEDAEAVREAARDHVRLLRSAVPA